MSWRLYVYAAESGQFAGQLERDGEPYCGIAGCETEEDVIAWASEEADAEFSIRYDRPTWLDAQLRKERARAVLRDYIDQAESEPQLHLSELWVQGVIVGLILADVEVDAKFQDDIAALIAARRHVLAAFNPRRCA